MFLWWGVRFLSTLSLRRATSETLEPRQCPKFLSTLSLRRATIVILRKRNTPSQFLSTLSLRRATALRQLQFALRRYFYPRSPCGERLPEKSESLTTYLISIHALLAESDTAADKAARQRLISIHALLAESDAERLCNALKHLHFYPRSPCGERPTFLLPLVLILPFLSTLSLRRATIKNSPALLGNPQFLSTLSLRRAT